MNFLPASFAIPPQFKTVCDWTVIVAGGFGTLVGMVPPIAGIVSIIWGALQIYDWIQKKRGKQ